MRWLLIVHVGLSFKERDAILDQDLVANMMDDQPGDDDPFMDLPPGEEGMFLSNAGGEEDVFHVLDDSTFKR